MLISFFVEFPKKEKRKLKYIQWPTKLYIAAPSLKEFLKLKKKYKHKLVQEYIYWPILKKEEGYWFSGFSDNKAMQRIHKELQKKNMPVMIDAEVPLKHNPFLFLREFLNRNKNIQQIKKIIDEQEEVYVAEYYHQDWKEKIMEWLGVHFEPRHKKHRIIKMVYCSMHKFKKTFLQQQIKEGKEKRKEHYRLALGTLSRGIEGTEQKIKINDLQQGLDIAKENNMPEVILYSLGGLNKHYASLLKRYAKEEK